VYSKYGIAIVAVPCTEVVFKDADSGLSVTEVPREQLHRTQTPQIFSLGKLKWAYEEAEKRSISTAVAPCSLMKMLGEEIHFSIGSEKNIKITTPDDIDIIRALFNLEKMTGLKGV
jgi:2-C-methyl-D-erythritol 4-phosphate cytidylyltransferase